jgi:hypothetical protein
MLRFFLVTCLIVIGFCDMQSLGNYSMCQKNPTRQAGGLRTTSFCELTQDKVRYSQQIVRTQAILVSSRTALVDAGETYLYHPSCRDENRLVLVEYDPSYSPNTTTQATLQQVLSEKSTTSHGRARVTIVGRFDASSEKGYGHLGGFQARISVTSLERIESVRPSVPWPEQQ